MTWRSRRPFTASCAGAGFSLVEMLVVLTILGLAAAVAAPRMADSSGARALRDRTAETAALLRRARAEAVRTGGDVGVAFDFATLEARAEWTDRGVAFPAGTDVEILSARQERVTQRRAAFRFFADGSATGGAMRFALPGARASIEVDWLTGRVETRDSRP